MNKYKVLVPFIVDAESEEDVNATVTSALANVDQTDVEFQLDSITDEDSIELLDGDNLPEGDESNGEDVSDSSDDDIENEDEDDNGDEVSGVASDDREV